MKGTARIFHIQPTLVIRINSSSQKKKKKRKKRRSNILATQVAMSTLETKY